MNSSSEEHIVYVTSSSCLNVYPHNLPHAFENQIQSLKLNPSLNYEVGMSNILLPSQYYILRENERDHAVKIYLTLERLTS